MLDAYKKFWKGYVNFSDRSTRADYWWVQLWHFLITLIPSLVVVVSFTSSIFNLMMYELEYEVDAYYYDSLDFVLDAFSGISVFVWLMLVLLLMYSLAVFIPDLAVTVRRIRDAGFHWAMIFLLFIPVGRLVIFVFTLLASKESEYNRGLKRF